jgi:Zn-dependent M28 family amino/carboxypeptidase
MFVLAGCSQKTADAALSSQPAARSDSAPSQATLPSPPAGSNAADSASGPLPQFNGNAALQFVREVTAFGPRWVGSPGHAKTESFLRVQLKGTELEQDTFSAATPAGSKEMSNYIARFSGTGECIIVVAGHYDTLYERSDFVGANDGGSSTGLLLELAQELGRTKKREGCSVWLAWLDGEEAFRSWTDTDSVYGSRHLAAKWQAEGVLKRIKTFLLVDMVGDADLNIERDSNSTPWLEDLVYQAASRCGYQSHFFARTLDVGDDHIPFAKLEVPVVDLIDFDYGYDNAFWHTKEDTMDKLSPKSLEIVGSVVELSIQMISRR